MKRALVCGAGGFIGSHLVRRLKAEGYWVAGVDLKRPEYSDTAADEFVVGDLRDPVLVNRIVSTGFHEIYQLAADMGGAGYLFTGENDADVMHNSALINLNVLHACIRNKPERVFFSSSACVYPQHNQTDPQAPTTAEASVYPADPDSDYGWEKLFSERLYAAFGRNYHFAIRVGRFHNIFGPEGTWAGGKEKVPAAMCRKVAEASDGDEIEVWGDGEQTRSFLFIDEALEGVRRLVASDVTQPLNIGSDEMISINGLAEMVMRIAGKRLRLRHLPGPLGVRGRNSDNALIRKELGWAPDYKLERGMRLTYAWVESQVRATVKK
jgi:nucleoside-diphosphate-sugar epimerase